ncbi:hypothetical protein PCIT_b0668 [Pseudoalteromonas citrea]|uniref:AB hydrolase-1 domain-containing protein n=2 Tax=Pseudoalteromonas citrea TaxID=43655 RepID=A0AAD4FQ35_9GAMM|nr:alpha/beta hydrolase [Pseudoalteromonas citrea]KAF7764628.1 hypothetical protein PCIT_b0668 [Pseudoalteromonas citrea]
MAIDEKNTINRLAQCGLAAQIYGNGPQWVICLHGWLDNSNSFVPMANLQQPGYKWLMIDLPGHGQSRWRSKDAHYYFIDYVYDLLNVLDELDIEKCHLVGHSLGSLVCGLFTTLYPQRVNSLSMIEGIGLMYSDEAEIKQQITQSFKQRQQIRDKATKHFPSLEALVQLRVSVSDFGEKEAKLLMSRNSKEAEGKVYLTTDPRLKTHSAFRFSLDQSMKLFEEIKIPSLLILGTQGYGFVKSNLEQFKSCFDSLQVEIVEGGHHCHMQNPSRCIKSIETHLNAINGT